MKNLIFVSICALFLWGCNSKYEEASPEKVAYSEEELQERVKVTTIVDKKIQEIERMLNHINFVEKTYLKAQFQKEFQPKIVDELILEHTIFFRSNPKS